MGSMMSNLICRITDHKPFAPCTDTKVVLSRPGTEKQRKGVITTADFSVCKRCQLDIVFQSEAGEWYSREECIIGHRDNTFERIVPLEPEYVNGISRFAHRMLSEDLTRDKINKLIAEFLGMDEAVVKRMAI